MEQIERILVVDFGGQTAHLICRRLRDSGVYAQIIAPATPVFEWLESISCPLGLVRGLILSGSPFSVYQPQAPQPHPQILALAALLPTLGICYGLHWLAQHLGGCVEALPNKEYGPNPVELVADNPLLHGVPRRFTSWMSHADSLSSLPPHFVLLGQSEQGLPAIVCAEGLKIADSALFGRAEKELQEFCGQGLHTREWQLYGLQFHPEASHCQAGSQFLANFAQRICGCPSRWRLDSWQQSIAAEIRRRVGKAPVLLLISGGVDSCVVAALLLRCLPQQQLHLLYFDTGLMRQGETEEVLRQLAQLGARHVHQVDARSEFLAALAGATEPEAKRRIVGDLFIQLQQREITQIFAPGTDYFLAQGTLYTDMIESGLGAHAAVIKSHHNVSAPLIRELRRQQRLVEPLAELYKDEVRRLGKNLGLDDQVTQRQPFPGPGLAIRILGEVTQQRLELLRAVDQVYLQTLRELGVFGQIWQAFAVWLPVQSVGVTGDSRRYGPVIALRAITSQDGMSAEPYPFAPQQLQTIATRLCNRFPEISRVVYDISAKPPATIEWE